MKVATFNINNVNRRLENLLAWLDVARPDVVCLQELKTEEAAFPHVAINAAGYHAVLAGQRTWNGVAILSRSGEPVLVRRTLPGGDDDTQARYIEAAIDGVLVASIYLPNGNPNPGPKFNYKLAWMERLRRHAASLLAAQVPVILAGDFNVAPTESDIYQPNHWQGDALVDPRARESFAQILGDGWVDGLRAVHPSGPLWTFWAYIRRRWENDKGLRLDHLLLSPRLADRLIGAGVDKAVRGREGASDHAPAWIELAPARRGPRKPRSGK
ncbi:exodeoxyribonuclease III [Phenylobacterium sp. LjRoot164]|uniref:exodeoxyribonuclease III n=1 Tax=unclassified Phenylobacterium TaxID=2640670 RepID=UPI003ED10161